MVKLLRLTSTEDCIFEADLDAGIALGENSSIGLQNLTFESIDFTSFRVNSNNNVISFSLNRKDDPGQPDVPAVFEFLTSELTIKDYTSTNLTDFWEDLEATLNECLLMDFFAETGTAYGSFRVLYPSPEINLEKVVIVFKLAPMQMMFNYNKDGAPREGRFSLMATSRMGGLAGGLPDLEIEKSPPNINGTNLGNMNMAATLGAVSNRQHYVYPREGNFGLAPIFSKVEWSRGSGMFMVRVQQVVDNGGDADTNGFSIGFSNLDLQALTNDGRAQIENNYVFFEIRIKRPQDFYEFITPDNIGVPQVSTLRPYAVAQANVRQNDRIIFRREGNVIIGTVYNTSVVGGLATDIFTYTLGREQMKLDLYPFISIFGAKGTATVGHPNITYNPIINPLNIDGSFYNNDKYVITGLEQGILDNGDGNNCFENMFFAPSPGFVNVVPDPDNQWYRQESQFRANTVLKINGSILRLMGFDDTTYSNNIEYSLQTPLTDLTIPFDDAEKYLQFNIIPDGLIDLSNSDNYIVMLDSNPLFSYDASKYDYTDQNSLAVNLSNTKRGRRKNILATIPVNNNDGTVEYRANEPIYIDLDNRFPQVIKNLRLRVLNKNFDKIQTTGESVLTLLLKDK